MNSCCSYVLSLVSTEKNGVVTSVTRNGDFFSRCALNFPIWSLGEKMSLYLSKKPGKINLLRISFLTWKGSLEVIGLEKEISEYFSSLSLFMMKVLIFVLSREWT